MPPPGPSHKACWWAQAEHRQRALDLRPMRAPTLRVSFCPAATIAAGRSIARPDDDGPDMPGPYE